ncbi:hypothetical protein HanRHA438_Chr17g0835201 [Helianthus annuus]|nr:hypothetical protein HanRHA438_Chr17g0835201 [Helianthus annuus]
MPVDTTHALQSKTRSANCTNSDTRTEAAKQPNNQTYQTQNNIYIKVSSTNIIQPKNPTNQIYHINTNRLTRIKNSIKK